MKKIFANLLALSVCAAAFGGCAKPEEKKYGAEEMTKAFWLSDTMYNESVMMVKEKDGAAPTGNLAFVPTGKVKVTNPTMTVTYEEGKDYKISGRTIEATAETSMPWLKEEVLFGIDMPEGKGLSLQPASEEAKQKGYENILYTESAFLIENQVLVTYDYDKSQFDQSTLPAYQGDKLSNTRALLEAKAPLQIIAYGDSISTGCNSTGGGLQSIYDDTYPGNSLYIPFDRAPYTPTFPEMFAEGLAEKYGSDVGVYGAAMGGQTSDWGARSAAARVVNPDMGYDPDLVTITFGMNDATLGVPLDRFEENLLKIIDDIRAVSGKAVEFILIGTMLANSNASQCKNQEAYWPVMQKVAALREGVAASDMGGMHKFFLQNKKPADMLANNINHPNDFLIRMYAMNLLATLIQE